MFGFLPEKQFLKMPNTKGKKNTKFDNTSAKILKNQTTQALSMEKKYNHSRFYSKRNNFF